MHKNRYYDLVARFWTVTSGIFELRFLKMAVADVPKGFHRVRRVNGMKEKVQKLDYRVLIDDRKY